MFRKIWEGIAPRPLDTLCEAASECDPERRLEALDLEATGEISVEDIHAALRDILGLRVDATERSLAAFVHSFADTNGDGRVTLRDFETFCEEMPELYANQKWRLAFPKVMAPGLAAVALAADDASW